MKRKRELTDFGRPLSDRPSSSGRPLLDLPSSSHSIYGEPVPLKLHQTVFLSHSGVNKDFVSFLYKDLRRRYNDTIAFFDIESLPKATPISMENILEVARSSKLGVLVLTEDFFMKTSNPMRELEAFVASKVQLLPLFFGMSVDQFKEESRRAKWEEQWRKWSAKKLGGWTCVEETMKKWRDALDIVATFSGLEYEKEAKNQSDYVDRIVKEVTRIVPPQILLSKKGVFGKDRLCQIVNDIYKECASSRLAVDGTTQATCTHASSSRGEESYCKTLDVVGIYGFAGIGKTTLSKCLYDFYFAEFNGKVCYINLGPYDQGSFLNSSVGPFTLRMQHMLSTLTDYTNDFPYFSSVDQVKELLIQRLSLLADPIFLAIDIKVLHPDLKYLEAKEEAEFYLSCKFPKGSKIFITSRSQHVLENLTNQHDRFSVVIKYMPPLLFEEARKIFVHGMRNLRSFEISNIEDEVSNCVNMCIIELPSLCTTYYHPLLLEVLSASVNRDRDFEKSLRMLQAKGIVYSNDALEKVFKMLDLTFAILSKEEQKMFLDFVLFCDVTDDGSDVYAWIKGLYSRIKNLHKVFLQLKELCFIEEESWRPPNLVVEFCRYKVTQGEYAQYYEVAEANAHWQNVIPRSVRYISISGCGDSRDRERADLDLRDVETLEVLQLVGINYEVEVLLSWTTFARLRSLTVRVPPGTSLQFTIDGAPIQPRRLFWLKLEGNVCFQSSRRFGRYCTWLASNAGFLGLRSLVLTVAPVAVMDLSSCVLGAFQNLEVVSLSGLPSVKSIDVTTCRNLKDVSLEALPYLRSIGGLDKITSLESLRIEFCNRLRTLPIGASCRAEIFMCSRLKRISVCSKASHPGADSSTKLGGSLLLIYKCPSLRNVDGLFQYTGMLRIDGAGTLEELFKDLVEAAVIDSSICKAKVKSLALMLRRKSAGLAGIEKLCLQDAQHVGFFISALSTTAHPNYLEEMNISCKEDGDCGCDKDLPQFGILQLPLCRPVSFAYHCPQVRDLGSLAHSESLRVLNLKGCTSVEVWPDFATMSGLEVLDLSYTSIKAWPTSLLLLRSLKFLSMRGCKQLPAEEVMKGITTLHETHLIPGHVSCILGSLQSLSKDLEVGERDRCSVLDALYSYDRELVALFRQISSLAACSVDMEEVEVILEIMYRVWFREGDAAHASLPDAMNTKLGRLLSMILSLPFHYGRNGRTSSRACCNGEKFRSYTSVAGMVRRLMGVALIGAANIGYTADVNDDLLKGSIIPFLKYGFTNFEFIYSRSEMDSLMGKMFGSSREVLLLQKQVREAVCKMESVPIVAAAVGEFFLSKGIQSFEAWVHEKKLEGSCIPVVINYRGGYLCLTGCNFRIQIK